ncbi:AraC family transcriptional regulator [Danxiaibacter flavus]|uniref:AraC family transcriptional regulator n=1 Tax=Danxiaibacter flavus TaxID=3049108 RepID=A0ABV3ZL42_9BACT|nr:AraC family transcriptional regulator [Chitinophagaceae bacterium DXS]
MEAIKHILHYIHKHFTENLSLEKLAAEAHYSPYHFHRLFKEHVGEPPLQYLIRLRLEQSTKELLFYPDKSIYAIAIDCGFSSQSVFARSFKSKYNTSAAEYRKQALQIIQDRTNEYAPDVQQYPVSITRLPPLAIAGEIILLNDEEGIIKTFHQLHNWAFANELSYRHPEYYGVFLDSPFSTPLDKCRYMAGIRVSRPVKDKVCNNLGGVTIAQIPVLGNYKVLTDYAMYVKKKWVKDSGYQIIQGIPGFEQFSGITPSKPYAQHYRTICIGIQPV